MADDHVKIKLPQLPPYPADQSVKSADMIYVWNIELGQLQHAQVGQLPFGSGGGGGGTTTMLGSPFTVRLGDEQITIVGGNTIVSDTRLAGKKDYPVNSTQVQNSRFRTNEVTYDELNGTVTILGFILQSGEEITLYPDGIQTSGGGDGGSLQPVLDRLAAVESILSVFTPSISGANHARVWWVGGLPLPAGWQEDTDWRDYLPLPVVSADKGKVFGANAVRLKSNQQGSFKVMAKRERSSGTNGWRQLDVMAFSPTGATWKEVRGGDNFNWGPVQTIDLSDASTDIDIRNKSKGGMWIKYVGV